MKILSRVVFLSLGKATALISKIAQKRVKLSRHTFRLETRRAQSGYNM